MEKQNKSDLELFKLYLEYYYKEHEDTFYEKIKDVFNSKNLKDELDKLIEENYTLFKKTNNRNIAYEVEESLLLKKEQEEKMDLFAEIYNINKNNILAEIDKEEWIEYNEKSLMFPLI